jgi:hypothetical protein
MAYALIPDGYSLKKVTKLQKRAVDEKRRHDNVMAFISNEAAMTGSIALGAVLASGTLGALFLSEMGKQGFSESEIAKAENAFLEASLVALPINPLVFAPAAAKASAEKVSKFWIKFQQEQAAKK